MDSIAPFGARMSCIVVPHRDGAGMSVSPARSTDDAQGQATYGTANLRKERTGLPCIVLISQKDAARHDDRVKVAPGPAYAPTR